MPYVSGSSYEGARIVNGNPNGVTIDLNGYSLDINYLGENENELANKISIINSQSSGYLNTMYIYGGL